MSKSRFMIDGTVYNGITDLLGQLGMTLDSSKDKNIGRICRLKDHNPNYKEYSFIIVSKQLVWGFDANGKYTLVDGYRGIPLLSEEEKNEKGNWAFANLGIPFALNEIEFISIGELS